MIKNINEITPIPDRPLVTVALFAYNQEKYIREAVQSAFAQTYEPLEIILSDDCSTDRTFEIISELVSAYDGTHRTVLNRTDHNIGTIDHVVTVARKSRGQLIVPMAGDDISDSNRVEEIVNRWLGSKACVVQSHFREINAEGELITNNLGEMVSTTIQKWFRNCDILRPNNGIYPALIGPTAAYERQFLADIPLNNRKCLNEDALTTILCILNKHKIETINLELLSHRRHYGNVSSDQNASTMQELKQNELSLVRFSHSTVNFIDFVHETIQGEVKTGKPVYWLKVAENMMAGKELYSLHANIWDMTALERIHALIRSKKREQFLFILPRVFGFGFFIGLKRALILFKS